MSDGLRAEVKNLPENPPTEPALSTGSITATFSGITALVLYFAPGLSGSKYLPAIAIVGAFAIPIIQAVLTRKRVWSPASVKEVVDIAVADALDTARKNRSEGAFPLKKPPFPPSRGNHPQDF